MANSNEDPLSGFRKEDDPKDPRASALLKRLDRSDPHTWSLIGIPYDGGIPGRPGARFGPAALRQALAAFTSYSGIDALEPVADLGDVSLAGLSGGDVHRTIEETSRRAFGGARRAVFVGGDHGCTGSLVRGLAAARPHLKLALISVDAHLDVREYTSDEALSSGTPFRRALETDVLVGQSVAMIGLRPFANSRHYMEWATGQGVRTFSADDVADRGAAAIARAALESAAAGADAIYLSIDLDAADSAFAPGVSAPATGGLTSREMINLVSTISSDPRLVGADIMELSPPYDVDTRTARLAARLLLEIIGPAR